MTRSVVVSPPYLYQVHSLTLTTAPDRTLLYSGTIQNAGWGEWAARGKGGGG